MKKRGKARKEKRRETRRPHGKLNNVRNTMKERAQNLPKIYYVNWFRQGADGKYLWPGFGENCRVLKWIFERSNGNKDAIETPNEYTPRVEDIEIPVGVSKDSMQELLKVDVDAWKREVDSISEYMKLFGSSLPEEMKIQMNDMKQRLNN